MLMKKIAYGFEVETTEDGIRITQIDAESAQFIIISPDEVGTLVAWLQQARDEVVPIHG